MTELLCLDIDGTLLNSRKELTRETVEAVQYAKQKGVRIFLASGRSFPGMKEIMQALGTGENCICMNGALICAEGKEIYRDIMSSDMVDEILRCAEKYGSQVFFAGKDFNLSNRQISEQIQRALQNGSLRGDYYIEENPEKFREMVNVRKGQILKAAIKELEEENYKKLREELECLESLRVAKSDDYFVDLNSKICSKGQGIKILADYYGISIQNVMCIGDNENDIEMIQAAGIGIAMKNGADCVKQEADFITDSNDENGAAHAIYRFI